MDIRIRNVYKEFDRFPALNGVSLEIRSGELIALLGPSGSGKTTLLRLIAGLERPSRGAIYFGDEDASQKSVQERNVGFVFQHYALFKHLTIADNIGFGLKVRPKSRRPGRADILRKASELLDLVQLSGLESRFPAQLSGGQRQRVALARALAIDPRVLLLDEPFGALDARVRKDLRRWLRDLHDRTGHTTVFVTHDQEEALELADRVAILNHGRIEQIGSADDIYDRPASPFVISFVGDTNRLAVNAQNGGLDFEGRAFSTEAVGAAEGPAHLYARPGDIELLDHYSAPLVGIVTQVRRTAGGLRAQLELGSSRAPIEVETSTSLNVGIGDRVGIRIQKGWLFGAQAVPAGLSGQL